MGTELPVAGVSLGSPLDIRMADSVCDRCKAPCPKELLSNGLCAACVKETAEKALSTVKQCANGKCGVALRPAQKSKYCDSCDKAREGKWVTQDALENKLREANLQQAQMFNDFKQSFMSETKDLFMQLKDQGSSQPAKPNQLSVTPPASGSADTQQSSPDNQYDVGEELDYDETRSMYGPDHGHDGRDQTDNLIDTSDSVSQVGSVISGQSVAPSALMGKVSANRSSMLQKIASLVDPPAQVVEEATSDPMKEMFGNTGVFEKDDKKPGVGLSMSQRQLLDRHLYPNNPESVPAFSQIDAKSVPIVDKDFKYFRTPMPNKEVLDYISIVRQRNSGGGNVANLAPAQVFRHNPKLKACEHEMFRMDQAARVGLRHALYGQWLGTAVKMLLRNELGEDHALLREDSDLNTMLEELFLASHTASKQFANIAAMSACQRRRLILDEMQLQPHVLKSCLELPLDQSGEFLFGDKGKEGEENRNLDCIIAHYCEKVSSVRKFGSAFVPPARQTADKGSKRPASAPQGNKEKKFKSDGSHNKTSSQTGPRGQQNKGGYSGDDFRRPSGFPPKSRRNYDSGKHFQGRRN